MSQKMKYCKVCNTQIAANAKACPACGAKNKKPVYKRPWLYILIVLAVIVIAAAAGGSDDAKQVPAPSVSDEASDDIQKEVTEKEPEKTEPAADAEYSVGEGSVTTRTDSIGTKWIRAAVPVTNTGSADLYLSSATLDIENADGTLSDSLNMVNAYPQVIGPGETAWYFENTTFDGDISGTYAVVPHIDVKKAKVDKIRYEVTEVQLKDTDYLGMEIVGRVENTTDKNTENEMVYVVTVLYGENGVPVDQVFTILDKPLAPGEKISFEMSSLDTALSSSDVADYEVFAFPYQYQF